MTDRPSNNRGESPQTWPSSAEQCSLIANLAPAQQSGFFSPRLRGNQPQLWINFLKALKKALGLQIKQPGGGGGGSGRGRER